MDTYTYMYIHIYTYIHITIYVCLCVAMNPISGWFIGCWELYILATSKVISVCALTCNSTHLGWLYSAVPLPIRYMIQYSTQSPYPNTKLTSPCSVLLLVLVLSAKQGSTKHQWNKSLVWLNRESNSQSPTPALDRFGQRARFQHQELYIYTYTYTYTHTYVYM